MIPLWHVSIKEELDARLPQTSKHTLCLDEALHVSRDEHEALWHKLMTDMEAGPDEHAEKDLLVRLSQTEKAPQTSLKLFNDCGNGDVAFSETEALSEHHPYDSADRVMSPTELLEKLLSDDKIMSDTDLSTEVPCSDEGLL